MEKGILNEHTIRLNKLCKILTSCYRGYSMKSMAKENPEITSAGLAILISLYYSPSDETISDLADSIDVSKGLVSREVEKLRQRGYVTITIDKNDRRIVRPQLCEKAIPIVEREMGILSQLTEKLTEGITEDEFSSFMETCNKIQDNVKQLYYEI